MTGSAPLDYLVVNHSPFGPGGRAGRYLVGDMWLQDLRAQADALRREGGRLIVACPLREGLTVSETGSFGLTEVDPREAGFEFRPLPAYHSITGWARTRAEVRRRLRAEIARADIVHLGDGAHPIPMDQLAWPMARDKVRIFVYDGADVLSRLRMHADSRPDPLRRMAQRWLVRRREAFFRRAIREADLVFAHNASVVKRFGDVWNERCHFFDRSFVTEETLAGKEELAQREEELLDASRPLRLVLASRQIRIKGTDHVLRAMRAALDRGVRLELDVFGDGEDLPSFRALAGELSLHERVRFHGALSYGPDLLRRVARSQVMVVPNLTPEISRNVLLAMSLGLPVLAYRNPGIDELIEKNDAGLLVPAGDVAALSRGFETAADDRARLVEILRNGRRLAGANTLQSTHRRRAELALRRARAQLAPSGIAPFTPLEWGGTT